MPRFGFDPEEAREIATFLVGLVNDIVPKAAAYQPDTRHRDILRGREIVRRFNCQGCHVIEGEGGDVWPAISQKKEKWRPPDLLGQGIKTDPQWLFRFLKDPAFVTIPGQADTDRVRPWHSIRMPTFPLTDEEARALVRYFAALSDTTADFESAEGDSLVGADAAYASAKSFDVKDPQDPTKKVKAGAKDRLEEAEVLFRQYECKSCHSSDPKVPIGNRAPNFRHTRGGRLRESWIRTWLWGPSKLQPGTAMPTFFAGPEGPVAQDVQFFGGDPDAQIRALKDFIRHHYREED
jgi:mono/diheme cytochrome c family protein